MIKKTVHSYEYGLAGFPVFIEAVEVEVHGYDSFANIDHDKVQKAILLTLASKRTKLTGDQVRYIRHSYGDSMAEFAARFGFTAPAIQGWEKRGGSASPMGRPTELMIKSLILMKYKGSEAYREIVELFSGTPLLEPQPDEAIRIHLEAHGWVDRTLRPDNSGNSKRKPQESYSGAYAVAA